MGMPVMPAAITLEEAVGEIIESVAMEETALAHILNAESEKLMAVINSTAVTTEDLIAINQSVKNMVKAISRLELLLLAKLELFAEIICA